MLTVATSKIAVDSPVNIKADVIFSTCVPARRNALLEALLQKNAPEIRQVVISSC